LNVQPLSGVSILAFWRRRHIISSGLFILMLLSDNRRSLVLSLGDIQAGLKPSYLFGFSRQLELVFLSDLPGLSVRVWRIQCSRTLHGRVTGQDNTHGIDH
jgi:hypothetical protein